MGIEIKILLGVLLGLGGMLVAGRVVRAGKEPIPDDECVSCGAAVRPSGPGLYVCPACGYEGGSGRADQRRRELAARYEDLEPEVRAAKAAEHVQTAARILSNYAPRSAAELVASVVLDLDEVSGDERHDASATSVAADLSSAATELQTASAVAGGVVILPGGARVNAIREARILVRAQEATIASVVMRERACEVFLRLRAASAVRASDPSE